MNSRTKLQESLQDLSLSRDFTDMDRRFGIHRLNLQAEIFDRLWNADVNQPIVLLDIGCGKGVAIEQAIRTARQWVDTMRSDKLIRGIGLDVNPLNDGKEEFAEFLKGDACDLPLADNSIDVAYSTQTFLYVSKPFLALEECYRVLKPGGVALIELKSKDVSLSPSLPEILHQTPGAEGVFDYLENEVEGYKFGSVVIRKSDEDRFRGFHIESYLVWTQSPSDPTENLIAGSRRAIWGKLTSN